MGLVCEFRSFGAMFLFSMGCGPEFGSRIDSAGVLHFKALSVLCRHRYDRAAVRIVTSLAPRSFAYKVRSMAARDCYIS